MILINTYYHWKICSLCLNTHIHLHVMGRGNTTIRYKRRHANNPTSLRSVNDLISYVGTSLPHPWTNRNLILTSSHPTCNTSRIPTVCLYECSASTLHAASVKTAVLLLLLASLLCKWEVSHDRDHSTSPGSLTFHTPCFCYSAHAQPMPVTFTLLAHAKCRAILETHRSCSAVSTYDKLFKDHLF